MRTEPIELSDRQLGDSRGNPQPLNTGDGVRPPAWNVSARREVAIEAVDEAFAAFADQLAHVEHTLPAQTGATTPVGTASTEMVQLNRSLVATIVSQLELLDRQRGQLRRLLANIDGAG